MYKSHFGSKRYNSYLKEKYQLFEIPNLVSGIATAISIAALIISSLSYRLNMKSNKIEHRNKLNDYIFNMYKKTSKFADEQNLDHKTKIKLSNEITISEVDQLLYYIDFLITQKLVDIEFLKNNIGLNCILTRYNGIFKNEFYVRHKSIIDQLKLTDTFHNPPPK